MTDAIFDNFSNLLTFTTLFTNSADNKLVMFFLFFTENRLSHKETICMKHQCLFSGDNK